MFGKEEEGLLGRHRTSPRVSAVPAPLQSTATHLPRRLGRAQGTFGRWRRRREGFRRAGGPKQTQLRAGTCLSVVARISQRKTASPALRTCCWSGEKVTACTGSEWPMYT